MFLLILLIHTDASAKDICERSIRPIIKDINARISALTQSIPATGIGEQLDVGSCALRLKRLEGNFLCCKTHANIAPIWEEISCLRLKRYQLKKQCDCAKIGLEYSAEEVSENRAYAIYLSIKALKPLALAAGVRDKIVREYIKNADKALECVNENNIALLSRIETELRSALPRN